MQLRNNYHARKVPEVSAHFWAMKLISTAMGEALSDFLVLTINPVIAVILGFIVLVIALIIQFRVKKYQPVPYWFVVSMVAVFGTMAADVLHVVLGVSYGISSLGFAILLAIVFIVWRSAEKSLSIHTITTMRREVFYWLTVMATFALGTAAGDYTAAGLHLGYLGSIILFTGIILIPLVMRVGFGANEVGTFWFAYIITRPLGASVADWFGISKTYGGLGFGRGVVSLVLIAALVVYVLYIQAKDKRQHLLD